MILQLPRHKFSAIAYQQMVETGIISPSDRVELIDGEIIEMSPIGRRHAAYVARLDKLWQQRFSDRVLVWVQNPIHLSDTSEPQPDLAILKPRDDFYLPELPTPKDILLVVEVSDSTLTYDQEVKIPLYAAAGISETWLLDINGQVLETHIEPATNGYKHIHRYERNDTFSILAFPDVTLAWTDVFGD